MFWFPLKSGFGPTPPLAACLLLGLAALPARADDEEMVGFVLELAGTWQLDGKRPVELKAGSEVPGGATLIVVRPTAKSLITICFYSGEAKTYKSADKKSVTLPKVARSSLSTRLWAAIRGQYRGGVVHAISRGDGLVAGVVKLDEKRLDLTPILLPLPDPPQSLRFTSLAEPPAKDPPPVVVIQWSPEQPHSSDAANLTVGLYKVELLNRRSKQPTGAETTVLICSPSDYTALNKAFDQAKALTDAWDEQARATSAAAFLESFLTALATQSQT